MPESAPSALFLFSSECFVEMQSGTSFAPYGTSLATTPPFHPCKTTIPNAGMSEPLQKWHRIPFHPQATNQLDGSPSSAASGLLDEFQLAQPLASWLHGTPIPTEDRPHNENSALQECSRFPDPSLSDKYSPKGTQWMSRTVCPSRPFAGSH